MKNLSRFSLLFVMALGACAQRIEPNPALTPGATLDVTTADVCVAGYTQKVRNVPVAVKRKVYAEYGVKYVPRQYEVDHLIPLELGGSNSIKNLWPEPYKAEWNARVKDRLEGFLHREVCSGQMSLQEAQQSISNDWIGTYRLVFHTQEPRYVQRQIKERD